MGTAVAAEVKGTVVHEVCTASTPECQRSGHPAGVMEIGANVAQREGEWYAESVTTQRTTRRIMEGAILVPQRYIEGKP